MTNPLVLLLLGLATTHALRYEERILQDVSPLWNPEENRDTYKHYPDEMKELLDATFKTLMRSPELYIFTTVPEPETRIWPLLKGMTLRNHLDNKILWAKPNYLITDGLVYGCREMVDGQEEHMPVESTLCDDHCVHQGRYCAPFEPFELPAVLPPGFKGKELVKESLRRLCFDHYYHASDTKYFEYLEAFERAQCLQQPDVTACSMEVINGVDHADYSFFSDCVAAESLDQDIENEQLETQLKDAIKYGSTLASMPELRIGNNLYKGPYDTGLILEEYCATFNERPMHPVACDVCGKCQKVRHCLWTLECDGTPLDPTAFLNEQAGAIGGDDDHTALDGDTVTQVPAPTAETPVASTLPPGAIAPGQATTDTAANEENKYKQEEEQSESTALTFFVVILLVVTVIGSFIIYRDRRSKFLMAEIHAEQLQNSTYRDDDTYGDYVDDPMRSAARDAHVELSPTKGNSPSQQPPNMAFLPPVS